MCVRACFPPAAEVSEVVCVCLFSRMLHEQAKDKAADGPGCRNACVNAMCMCVPCKTESMLRRIVSLLDVLFSNSRNVLYSIEVVNVC